MGSTTLHRPAARPPFSRAVLDMDCASTARRIEERLREITARSLKRRGLVLGVSGGIDSSVCAVLAARALGKDRVRAILMPERDSSPESLSKGKSACATAGIAYDVQDIAPPLEALGCYRKREAAIRKVFPQYRTGDRFKIAVAADVMGSDRVSFFTLVAELSAEGGKQVSARMPVDVYLAIVAATNMKQRVRKLMEYTLAEELNYGVIGTPNRLEYDQGFFVRGGDGLADVKPIALLYKTQVFAMARYLGLSREICEQTPTTDTYSLPQTQEEFYYALPYHEMDLMLWAYVHGVGADEAGKVMKLTATQVERVFKDIEAKRVVSRQLHEPAALIEAYDWGRAV